MSLLTHGRVWLDSAFRLIPFKYLLTGVLLFAIDYAITTVIFTALNQPLALAQWAGRLMGAAAGYWAHQKYTFRAQPSTTASSSVRYWSVAALLWLISPLLLQAALHVTPTSLLVAKLMTEAALVCASYLLLRYFVFATKPKP